MVNSAQDTTKNKIDLFILAFAALGVVYGDIGTQIRF